MQDSNHISGDGPMGNWEDRLPGEQWIVMESPDLAEKYLTTLDLREVRIIREPYPNVQGLYARIRIADRIAETRVFIPSPPGPG